ncbi:MAG: hypothetical protein PHU85_19560 [Phycisphaerae bacterium]|nr:hypothetical protein [Phycisphaerae bacterium]
MSEAKQTVYVQLLNEGTTVYRPTLALDLGHGSYRLLATDKYDPTDEEWEFPPGSIIKCEIRTLSDGPALVAVSTK